MRHLTIICAAAALAGCATQTYWNKPGGSESQFYSDRFACQQAAAASYPTSMMSLGGGQQSPSHTSCTGFGAMVNCTTTPGQQVAPLQIDANGGARQGAFESCLMAKGYRKQ